MLLPSAAFAEVKNIVLVHGANVDGTTWRDVYNRLTAEDYMVTVVQLPLTSVKDDVAAVERNLDVQDGPVLLVGHSYGGVVISEAGGDPDVKGLVYIAAFQPDAGESGSGLLASSSTNFTPEVLSVFGDGHYLVKEDAFVSLVGNGLSKEDAIFVARSQAMSNTAILAHEITAAAWQEKPSWSAIATEDRTIPPELQRQMAERAGSTMVEINNGHMLPMTSPNEVAALIRQAAESVE
jgi:pimeloyl-ACP methyl ester carboxylesterase